MEKMEEVKITPQADDDLKIIEFVPNEKTQNSQFIDCVKSSSDECSITER